MSDSNNPWFLVLGALIATIAGYIADETRAWRERARKKKALCISISDELVQIHTALDNMHQVWDKAQLLNPNFVQELRNNTTVYDSLRADMYLIKDVDLRRKISKFYKDVQDTCVKTDGKIGTLASSQDAITEQQGFDTAFQTLSTEAKSIVEKLK